MQPASRLTQESPTTHFSATEQYVRHCPGCEAENPAHTMRCACGALLTGVDLTLKLPQHPVIEDSDIQAKLQSHSVASQTESLIQTKAQRICPYEDCAQENPAESQDCLYCNRSLTLTEQVPQSAPTTQQSISGDTAEVLSLMSLPSALKHDFTIVRHLPTQGAEAELLLVQKKHDQSGQFFIAKIYRHGIAINQEVQRRMQSIPDLHKVTVLDAGVSDSYAYELMEYCPHGSLRQWMQEHQGPINASELKQIVAELSQAIASVHAAGLLHRDLKPENILIRSLQPLDLILTDFGIASVLDATQKLTGMARTLAYAAPESLSGVISAATDFWALGMILFEAAIGYHPFKSLSDAVILHHLSTRDIELNQLADQNLAKLLSGLFVRDPQKRWSHTEIMRWLAADPSLPFPSGQRVPVNFRQAYHLAEDVCHTNEQLAVALCRHWDEGVVDLINGQLLHWFRDVQKDQNACRLILSKGLSRQDQWNPLTEQRKAPPISIDIVLLHLIVYLAPGIPPVWRGEKIELSKILKHASCVLKHQFQVQQDASVALTELNNDLNPVTNNLQTDAEISSDYLHQLYSHKVLGIYAAAGNLQFASLHEKWQQACQEFLQAWSQAQQLVSEKSRQRLPGEYANIDQLMFGSNAVFGTEHAATVSLLAMHASILAMAFDRQWVERLRQRLQTAYAGLLVYCPWIQEFGEISQLSGPMLLVMHVVLPEAKKIAERHEKSLVFEQLAQQENFLRQKQDLVLIFAEIRTSARDNLFQSEASMALSRALNRYFEMLAQVRGAVSPGAEGQALKKKLLRFERNALKMQLQLDQIAERKLQNVGWLGQEALFFYGIVTFVVPLFVRREIFGMLLSSCCALLVWRVLPILLAIREIRQLAQEV